MNMDCDTAFIVDVHQRAMAAFGIGDTKGTSAIIKPLFELGKDTLCTLAQFFTFCKNLKSNKCLGYFVAKELEKWYAKQVNDAGKNQFEVTEDVKKELVPLITFSHSSFTRILIKVYSLDKRPNDFLKPCILDLIERGKIKDAISVTSKLGMQDLFTLYDMALPVLVENKLNLIEAYLQGSSSQTLEMLQLIDLWLKSDFDIIEFLQSKNIFQASCEVLRPKFLIKLLTRWLKMFMQIDDPFCEKARDLCPNLCKQKSLSSLKYLLYRHYVEELSSVENTQELIMKAVGNDKWLQGQLVDILGTDYGDWESAKQWAKLYDIQHDAFATSSQSAVESTWQEQHETWECSSISQPVPVEQPSLKNFDGPSSKGSWYDLSLPLEKVQFVDSVSALMSCLESIIVTDLVGIDSEWVPDFARNGAVSVSLLQLATISQVYLVDVSFFCNSGAENRNVFCEFTRKIFSSKDVLKIGFGISEDLRKLGASVPELEVVLKNAIRVTDLCTSVRVLERLYPRIFDFSEETLNDVEVDTSNGKKETGLSKLVHRCLGKPLNKCEQMSDWERRPLRKSQIIYATLDAYVLLELANLIHSQMKLAGIEHTLETIINDQAVRKKTKHKEKADQENCAKSCDSNEKTLIQRKQVCPQDFKVVCDTMLQGLGRQLRCCGVNVKILSNYDDHQVAAEIATKEQRVILTSGAPFQYLASQVPIGDCFDVPCGEKAKIQAAVVLEHYNVKVTPQDIFSRCQICNGNKYLKVSSEIMTECFKKRREILQAKQRVGQCTVQWDEIRNTANVGRGKHVFYNKSMHKKYANVGRGKHVKGMMVNFSPAQNQNLDLPRQMESHLQISEKLRKQTVKHYDNDYYEDYDSDDVLFMSSSSESPFEPLEFSPIKASSLELKPGTSRTGLENPASHDDDVKGRILLSNENETMRQADTSLPQQSDSKVSDDFLLETTHTGGKDGVIPYIINPKSVCTQGYVNLENVTIVYSEDDHSSDETSSSIDGKSTPLLCEQVPPNILQKVKVFYCCVKCGKVFWEGKHFAAVLEQFSDILCDE